MSALRELLQRASDRARARRVREFLRRLQPAEGARVLDVGGSHEFWAPLEFPLEITLLNLEEQRFDSERDRCPPGDQVNISTALGDGCDLSQYADDSFDIVMSNSVIEHVGDDERVAAFAREVQRVGKSYWVQTPCPYFPLEPHTIRLFYWLYPERVRRRIAHDIDQHNLTVDAYRCPIASTRAIQLRHLKRLFPGGKVYTERWLGWPKSWSIYATLTPNNPE